MSAPCPRCLAPLPAGAAGCPACREPAAEPAPAGEPAPAPARPPADRLAAFRATLVGLTPRVYVTPVLVAANLLVYGLMVGSGVSGTAPTTQDLIGWGANFGPATVGGQWWRLLTCAFVHIGFVHLLLNMWVLATAGPLAERMVGNAGFLLVYLLTGLAGSLASLLWNPVLVSAGASGAVFGVMGAVLAVVLRGRRSVPPPALAQLRASGLVLVAYNLFFGMTQPNVDSAAHVGGLAAGFLAGLVLARPFTPAGAAGRPARNLALAAAGAVAVAVGLAVVHTRHGGVAAAAAELERFEAVEKAAFAAYNRAVADAEAGRGTDADVAAVLEATVLPPWREAGRRLDRVADAPDPLRRHVAEVREYVRLREEGWELLVQAVRENDEPKAARAAALQARAEEAAGRMNPGGRPPR